MPYHTPLFPTGHAAILALPRIFDAAMMIIDLLDTMLFHVLIIVCSLT